MEDFRLKCCVSSSICRVSGFLEPKAAPSQIPGILFLRTFPAFGWALLKIPQAEVHMKRATECASWSGKPN